MKSKAYLPGTGPKPKIKIKTSQIALRLKNFQSHSGFIQATEFFNQGYYWEAHEIYEQLWREAETESIERSGLQVLIKLCALQLKIRQQQTKAAEQLHSWICQKIEFVLQSHPSIYGISLEDLNKELWNLEKSKFSKKLNLQILL